MGVFGVHMLNKVDTFVLERSNFCSECQAQILVQILRA